MDAHLDSIVEQHVEEATFLWTQRDNAVHAPNYSPQQFTDLDERLEAHIDGLRVAGEEGVKTAETILDNEGAEDFFPAAVLAIEARDGRFDVLGRVRVPQERRTGELTDDDDGPVDEVRRIDLDQLAAQLPGDVPPVYLDLVESRPQVTPADPLPVPPPTLDEGPHLSYAIQWFIFAACVLIGWVLAVRRSLATRRRAATSAPDDVTGGPAEQTSSGSPTSDDVASATTPT